nr:myosin-2-like isoform X2 [Ipomoea batatas]
MQKPIGLIALLDEESNFPKATDLTFTNKLKEHLKTNQCLKGERGGAFSIRHYAGEVLYSASGFLEKNRDLLHSDIVRLLSSCSSQLLQLFISSVLNQSQKSSPTTKLAVSDVRKCQLFQLMEQLENTTPHFIRCIKSNTKKIPGVFEKDLVLQQLQCCGILEVVRISRAGYPTRITHQDFTGRYGFLLSENNVSRDPLSASVAILQKFNIHPEMYQVGYTKLYLRAGQVS